MSSRNSTTVRNLRPVGTKFISGELKEEASEARKDGGPGACPRKIFQKITPLRSLENAPFLEMFY